MTDPFSTATGAAGLVSLAIGICQSLATYYASWKDYDRDIAHTCRYLENVLKNIVHLQRCLNRYDFPAALKQQAEVAILACDSEIKSLETEANLVRSTGPLESRRAVMKNFIRKTTYPFKESTLEKIKNSLSRIQSTVDSAIIILGLDSLGALTSTLASIVTEIKDTKRSITKISEELPLIRTTMEQHEQEFPTISAKMNLIASDVQGIKEDLHQIWGEKRLNHQPITHELVDALPSTLASSIMVNIGRHYSKKYQIQSNDEEPAEIMEKIDVLERQLNQLQLRCISKPRLLQTELDDAEDKKRLHLSLNSGSVKHLRQPSMLINGCSCRSIIASATSWSVSQKLQLNLEVIKSHRRVCPLSKFPAAQNRTLRLKSIYGARFLMKALEISLSMTHGAGGYAIASSVKMRTLFRGDSPAFQLFNTKPLDLISNDLLKMHEILGYMKNALVAIRLLFREGRASPKDINVEAKTILQSANDWIDRLPGHMRSSQVQSAREELLLGLAQLGVPLNHKDFYNEDVFTTVLKEERIYQHFSPQWHVYSSLCVFEPVSQPGSWFSPQDLFMAATGLEEYADFYDCGILSSAILARNERTVERILLERPQAIYERNKIGQTPMHLAADWLWGATRLISARAPCDVGDESAFYPIDYAFGAKNWAIYELLLANDSPIVGPPYSSEFSSGFSFPNFRPTKLPAHTFDKTCTALVNRRKRLANLALNVLTATDYEELGLHKRRVLDSTAREVYDLVVSRGQHVPLALKVSFNRSTAYHTPWLTIIEMAKLYNAGFLDVDSFDSLDQTPLMKAVSQVEQKGTFDVLEWLISKGANPLKEVTSFGTVQLHYIAAAMATYFATNLKPSASGQLQLSWQSITSLQYGVRLIIRECSQDLKDHCQCGCSTNGCSPLHLFLKCIVHDIHNNTSCRCQTIWTRMKPSPEECEQEIYKVLYHFVDGLFGILYQDEKIPDAAYREIIRLFVFKALGLTHTCCKAHRWCPAIIQLKVLEEIQEIRDEEREILLELDSLCEEGTVRRASYDGPFDEFLESFLSEIRKRPQARLGQEEIRKLEEIGVVLQNHDAVQNT